ncbi:MAG: hypothetical protein AAFZ05_10115 [Pseudomonadota bacterium]
MTLICPVCGAPGLELRDAIELGPDLMWDERTMQRARCTQCRSLLICSYLEKRNYHPDRDDTVSHTAFKTGSMVWAVAGLVCQKPQRRRAALWWVRFGEWVLKAMRKRKAGLPIRYVPPPRISD